ncbi:MAG: hypothetical protein ACXVKH_06215 [Candidatus Angelobacter sp.]
MAPFLHRLLRGAVLGMMLLIAGTANLICVSYDADNDDETPPVTVELNLVAPCKKSLHIARNQNQAGTHDQKAQPEQQPEVMASVAFESLPLLDKASPQLVVPLRT